MVQNISSGDGGQKTVSVYIAILFTAAEMVLIILNYFLIVMKELTADLIVWILMILTAIVYIAVYRIGDAK